MTGPPFDPYPAPAVSVRERAYDLVDRADARVSFPLLSRVDPYDEVVFAHDQLEPLRQETSALVAIVPEGSREILERIVELCEKGAGSDQAELRFVGD